MRNSGLGSRVCPLPTFCLLLSGGLMLLPSRVAATPPAPPANVRAVVLTAEVLLSWQGSSDAAYYRVFRADLDLRWMPIGGQVSVPLYRDGDFRSLPCYYQVVAYNALGELGAAPEFIVSNQVASISLYGVNPRPVSDTAFAVEWN